MQDSGGADGGISVDDFSMDRSVFDSGLHLGGESAEVPVSGAGPPGAVVRAAAVAAGAAAPEAAYREVATVGADGRWSGRLSVARAAHWYRVRVRIGDGETVETAARFAVGHVFAEWGQSEVARQYNAALDQVEHEPLRDGDCVQFFWADREAGTAVRVFAEDGGPGMTAALAARANALMAARPGEKFAFLFQTQSGTSFAGLTRDGDGRQWSDDRAVHARATADGQQVGVASVSWFAAPRRLGGNYLAALMPLFSGTEIDGTPVAIPGTHRYGDGHEIAYDHWFGELYDYAHTRWVAFGPHRFEPTDGTRIESIEACRRSWRGVETAPGAEGVFLPFGIDPLNYQNGHPNGTGGWVDASHPAYTDPAGMVRFARLCMYAALQSAGFVDWPVPRFDRCAWDPEGAHVEVWSSAGAVTTTRRAEGRAPLSEIDISGPGFAALGGERPAHWTEVFGWEINGAPAERAEIVGGRVRIRPNGGGAFAPTDAIAYGRGGATGIVLYPEDELAGAYDNVPIVDVGAAGLAGVSLAALPDRDVLANTMARRRSYFTIAREGPRFESSAEIGRGVSAATIEIEGMFTNTDGARHDVAGISGIDLRIQVAPADRHLSVGVRDSELSLGFERAINGVANGYNTIRVAVDRARDFAVVTVDGQVLYDGPVGSARRTFDSGRHWEIFDSSVAGEFHHVRIWAAAERDGRTPDRAFVKDLTGGPEAVNGDLWRVPGHAAGGETVAGDR